MDIETEHFLNRQCQGDRRKEFSMPQPTYFIQECLICGRPLEIRKEYHGKKVSCAHCGGWFTAVDPELQPCYAHKRQNYLLHKADELLEQYAPIPR
jgi:hypothetical protein